MGAIISRKIIAVNSICLAHLSLLFNAIFALVFGGCIPLNRFMFCIHILCSFIFGSDVSCATVISAIFRENFAND